MRVWLRIRVVHDPRDGEESIEGVYSTPERAQRLPLGTQSRFGNRPLRWEQIGDEWHAYGEYPVSEYHVIPYTVDADE